MEGILVEVSSSLRGSVENVASKGLLAWALASEDLNLSFS